MSNLPARAEDSQGTADVPRWGHRLSEDDSFLREFVWLLRRRIWLIVGISLTITLAAGVMLFRMIPVYSSAATIRVSGKEPNLPEVFRTLSNVNNVPTEMGILGSRVLVEDAVDSLSLRLRLVRPTRVSRAQLFDSIRVAPDARNGTYRLLARSAREFLLRPDSSASKAYAKVGEAVQAGGFSFVLLRGAEGLREIEFQIVPQRLAVADLSQRLAVNRPSREADIVTVGYEDADSQLVRRVPNFVAAQFIRRRQETQRIEARSTVKFLTKQIDRLSAQLATAEEQARLFREQQQVIDPTTEASKQVARLIDAQSERATLLAELETVQRSLRRVDSAAAKAKPGDPSPFRDLLAIPTLLKNQSTTELLGALTAVDEQRASLLMRRSPNDPDVKALSGRIGEIENQLHEIAATYLRGLEFQLGSLDSSLSHFSHQLRTLPRKEVEYNRLVRQTKTLEDAYTMLLTRLKEAQIAEAVEDPSIQVVDTAVTPLRPAKPRRRLGIAFALTAGLLIGVASAYLREHLDTSIRSRRDVALASGLPVLGLIPRIDGRSRRVALVAQRKEILGPPVSLPPARRPPPGPSPRYTFLGSVPEPYRRDPGPPSSSDSPVSGKQVRLAVNPAGNPAAEAYATLQTNLAFSSPEGARQVLVLTSALPGDGKTTCAVNLAITLALRGLRTVLIDADLRRGVLHHAFDVAQSPGLCEIVVGTASLQEALRTFEVEGSSASLHFLPCGAISPNPTGMLESANMKGLLAELRRTHDRIVIDSPPVNIVTDAAVLSSQVDGVLLVARSGVTDAAALFYAVDQLDTVSARVIGVILNDIDFRKDMGYDGAYKYYNYNDYLSRT